MGYASQKFATPKEFEKWLEENEHENKGELDKICSGKTNEWDNKVCHAQIEGDKLCLCKQNADGTFSSICELGVCTPTGETITAIKNSVKNIVNGTTVVGEATKATKDSEGRIISETYAEKYGYGEDDLTAGQSPLETGKLYFVYEPLEEA